VTAVEEAAHELKLLSEVLVRLERESFHSPLLAALRASLDTEGAPPSKRIGRLNRLMELLDSRDHVLIRMAEPFVFWTANLAFAVEAWRRHSGPVVRRWLTATGEMEALCSLASHAFEHPDDPFPELAQPLSDVRGSESGSEARTLESGLALLEAEAIGHPLIEESRVVRNDVRIGGAAPAGPRVLVVSGSNMSGKSTLLRSVGVNVVLAQAGAPVCAATMAFTPLQIGASLRAQDSLEQGVSRFFAEIKRLHAILAMASHAPPVLFLLDEILNGTNSQDRREGAEAVVRKLLERGAIGLLTTHDLALSALAEASGVHGANIHFQDTLEGDRLHFDYKIRPGVVTRRNALDLMRMVGIEVPGRPPTLPE
jgi:DNA mismatch repair ATPase MutS